MSRFSDWLRSSLGFSSPPVILPYRSYGNGEEIWLRGGVFDDRMLYKSNKQSRRFTNFKAMLSRMLAKPLAGVEVEIEVEGQRIVVQTNEEGLFEHQLEWSPSPERQGWIPTCYRVVGPLAGHSDPLESEGEVYIRSDRARFGIISDIDDTVLKTYARNWIKMLALTFTSNAHTRLPFKGVSELYSALMRGGHVESHNPLFYVSSSPWSLYDFLTDFMHIHEIPKGPLLLKSNRLRLKRLLDRRKGGFHSHKYEKIKHLLTEFEDLPFILIGDSGQHDAMIYSEIVKEFPGRVLGIYIRDVTKDKHDKKVLQIAEGLGAHKVEMLLVRDSLQAAEHALANGWIDEAGFASVTERVS